MENGTDGDHMAAEDKIKEIVLENYQTQLEAGEIEAGVF